MELLRRYSNRPDLLGPLVSVLRRVTDPAEDGHETLTTIEGRTASPDRTYKIIRFRSSHSKSLENLQGDNFRIPRTFFPQQIRKQQLYY